MLITNLNLAKHRLEIIKESHILVKPEILYKDKRIYLENLINKLYLLNPLNSLKRGCTLTYKDNKLVTDINNLNKKDIINIKFKNGDITAVVEGKEEKIYE